MKRASYREAIAWVADNDSAGDQNALVAEDVQCLITAMLIADIFSVSYEKVGKDIVKYREQFHR